MSKSALIFLMIFFGSLFSAIFYAPISAFLIYEIVYFVNPDDRWWSAGIPGIKYSMLSALLMISLVVLKNRERYRHNKISDQPISKYLVLFVMMYFLVSPIALLPGIHFDFSVNLLKLLIITLVAYKLIDNKDTLNAALWVFCFGSAYIGYVATITGRNGDGRVEGIGMIDTGGDGNLTAAAIAPALAFLIYKAWQGTWKIRFLAIFLGVWILNGIVLINSRGAFLAVVAGCGFLVFFMIFSRYQRQGQRFAAILIIIGGLSGGLYVADDQFWERMETIKEVDDGDKSGSHRIDFWLATFDILKDYPYGVGIGGYVTVSQEYLPSRYFENRERGKAVHSSWFQVLSEIGWIGFVVFISLIVCTFKVSRGTKNYLVEKGDYESYFLIITIEGMLLTFLVAASFIDRGRAEVLFWLIMFIAAAANVYSTKEKINRSL